MKKIALFSFIWFGISGLLLSQTQECGTVAPVGYEQTVAGRVAGLQPMVSVDSLVIVPVHIHLIRQSNGYSSVTLQDIQNELDTANFFFANAGLVFMECVGAEMIDDDSLYDYESTTDESYLLTNHFTPNVINLYYAHTTSANYSSVCGYTWFPGGPDAAFFSFICATNGSTLAHEFAHYMGVMHTQGGSPYELVDGSNCGTEGDLFCDTPADPNLSGLVDVNCNYTGTAVDSNNMAYVPDVTNIMSFSRKECRFYFSPMQYAMINSTYWTERTNLQCSTITVNETASLNWSLYPSPASSELLVSFGKAGDGNGTIELYDVTGRMVQQESIIAGATSQFLNVSRLPVGIYWCRISADGISSVSETFTIIR